MKYLKKEDIQIAALIQKEIKRQENTLMMIPSENIASAAVEEAVGSPLENKYAEGYPFKRYYQGQENVDQIESIAIERAKKLFKVPHVNVQPYSGSPANLAVYAALLEPGDKIMGLSLDSGGHLTHGAPVSVTGKFFRSVQYNVGPDGYLDYDEILKLAKKERPKLIIAGITAYPRMLNWKKFAEIAEEVDAYLHADISHLAGLIIGDVYPSPVPHVHTVMTTTHKTLRGPRGAMILVTARGLKKDPDMASIIDKTVFPGLQGGPHINTIAGIAVALREASKNSFKTYAKQVIANAKALASALNRYGFNLVTGGTDSHLILMDLRNKKVLGNTAAEACEEVGIVLNRNAVPYDPNPPFYPSGLRLGTPGITSRGMREEEMKKIAKFIDETITDILNTKIKLKVTSDDEKRKDVRRTLIKKSKKLPQIRREISKLCEFFPIKKVY